jgi:uncharacterized protein
MADRNHSDANQVLRMNPWRILRQRLEFGARRPLLVRRENASAARLNQRILFASDLHLRHEGPRHIVQGILDIASKEQPHVVLLGGDLVDWKAGFRPLKELVRNLSAIAPVGAIGGNHDRWIGLSSVRDAVRDAGGHWLEDGPLRWSTKAVAYGAANQPLLTGDYHVLCAHDPCPPASRRGFNLVLSGHLHGGQFVFFEYGGRLYPGAFAYRWNGLRFEDNDSTLIVSRGVQDTLPLRWNCPREVIAVDV